MTIPVNRISWRYLLLGLGFLLTIAVYFRIESAPGLSGSWLFDDYPNIVDNPGVQPPDASLTFEREGIRGRR